MNYSKDEIKQYVAEEDIKFIRLAFCDLSGRQKNISIHPDELDRAFTYGIAFDASAIPGFGDEVHSDLFLRPDTATLSLLPWRPSHGRVARFYCHIKDEAGQEFAQDGRKILRDAVAYAKERGVKVNFGAENDFYLFRTDEEGEPTDIPFDSAGFLDEAPEDRGEDVRRDICLTLEAMGIEPQYSQHISGPGQNRIDFAPGPALACADNVITFRSVVKMMAVRNGLWAAFSPKPIPDQAGNGFRIAMRPTRQGESCADAFLAGVLERFQEMQVFFNPREESYERLGTFGAPASVSWADTGRGALLRRKADGRLELSAADGAANPYLAFSLLIYAGVDGVQRGLSPAGLETGQPLAATLGEAKARCKESAFLQGLLPREILRAYTGR